MTSVLGISAYYHDSAAALVIDGKIAAAAQEERFTRIKHDHSFPTHAIQFCLNQENIKPSQIDYVGFYDKPLLKFERLLETYLAYAPRGFRSFLEAMPLWLRQKLYLQRELHRGLQSAYTKRFVFTEHHESHAASAFFPSPFEEAAILTLDGVGEWTTASYGVGRGNLIELTHELRFPHSLGLLYSAFTYFTGFKVNSGEYKLMGLAPYGEPIYTALILDNLIDLKLDGSFRLNMSYFRYCEGLQMTGPKFDELFDGPPRRREGVITKREMDIAASIQAVTEEIMLRCARHLYRETKMNNLVMAGGVALNCVGNGRIMREGPFDKIWVQPAAGDAGGALGVALFIWYQLLGQKRIPHSHDSQKGSLLGPQFDNDTVQVFLDSVGAKSCLYHDDEELFNEVANLLASGKVVGWFQGKMEFGPRALGARSILGDPRNTEMQSVMNRKIKFRESFRPFAPSVLRERAHDLFELHHEIESPYMLLVASVKEELRLQEQNSHERVGLERLKGSLSMIPAVTHVDYSARLQTVDKVRHGRFHRLLHVFATQTGCPALINTSFNIRGEPIVCTPADAYRCFLSTEMDALVLEGHLLLKADQSDESFDKSGQYFAQFELD